MECPIARVQLMAPWMIMSYLFIYLFMYLSIYLFFLSFIFFLVASGLSCGPWDLR